MPRYISQIYPNLKEQARINRKNMTNAEKALWSILRRKQLHGVQFYRQLPLDRFIVDFAAPHIGLIVEVDGSQHFEEENRIKDDERTAILETLGYKVIRFNNREVLTQLDNVAESIYETIGELLKESPPEIKKP